MEDEISPAEERDFRIEVTAFLQLLSESERHSELDLGVPAEEVPAQLCRYWFDELYLLSRRYLDEVKGDFSEAAAESFQSYFDDGELEALSRFHHFLELRLSMLESRGLNTTNLCGTDLWTSIVRDARNTLYLLKQEAS